MTTTRLSPHPRWEAFTRSFKSSNYITDFWNWLMTLMSKAAEMVLFGTVLYSGYQLLPGVPHVPDGLDAAIFVIQQGALDIGGMGLLKLAKRAKLDRASFPVRLGACLVLLMILNVALASIKHTLPMIPSGVFVGIETLLLIARAIAAVLYGHAIHALREEYGDSAMTVKEAGELQERIEEFAGELAQTHASLQHWFASELARGHASYQAQLATELAALHANLQQCQEGLQELPAMQARLQHLESTQARETHQQEERPLLRALPAAQHTPRKALPPAPVAERFDARAFVFACLRENPAFKLSEIEQLAHTQRQELSQSSISRYRKQFARYDANKNVSSSLYHASASLQMQGHDARSASDGRKVVGE